MSAKPNVPRPGYRPGHVKRTIRTLLSPEQLNAAVARESLRVDRKRGDDLSLVLFRIPGSKRGSLSSVRLIKTILKRIRVTDDLGWYDKAHVGLLLPDTTAAGAWALAQQVCDTVAQRGARPLVTMYTYPVDQKTVVRSSDEVQKVKIAG